MAVLKVFTFKAESNLKESAETVLQKGETFSAWVRSLVEKEIAKRKRAAEKAQ